MDKNSGGKGVENAKENPKLKDIFSQFADTTTAHGYTHVVNATHSYSKIFWIVVLIVCHVYVVINIVLLVTQYLEKPITTSVYFENELSPPFPVIVVCNENKFKKDNISDLLYEIEKHNDNIDSISRNISFFDIMRLLDRLEEKVFDYGTSFDEFIHSCSLYSRLDCKSRYYWDRTWSYNYGACFVFNDAYYKNGTKKNLFRVANTGPYESLQVVFNITQNQYYENMTHNAGLQIYIGDQGSFYHVTHQGYALSPGFAYRIQLRKRKILRVDPFDNGTCVKSQRYEFYGVGQNFVLKYDPELCGFICLAKSLITNCNCILGELPKIDNTTKVCSSEKDKCQMNSIQKFLTGEMDCLGKCRPPCEETSFQPTITSMQFPNIAAIKQYNMLIIQARENLIKIQVFYKSVSVEYWKERVPYALENLLGDIGGQLGLMVGISILTIFEFFCLFKTFFEYVVRQGCQKIK